MDNKRFEIIRWPILSQRSKLCHFRPILLSIRNARLPNKLQGTLKFQKRVKGQNNFQGTCTSSFINMGSILIMKLYMQTMIRFVMKMKMRHMYETMVEWRGKALNHTFTV